MQQNPLICSEVLRSVSWALHRGHRLRGEGGHSPHVGLPRRDDASWRRRTGTALLCTVRGTGRRRMITWASHAGQGTAEGVVPSSCVLLRPGPCFLRRARWRHMPCAGLTCLLRAGREACRCPAPDLKHEPREALAGFPPAPALHSVVCCWHAATGSVVASRVLSTSSAVPLTLPKH